MKRHMEKAFGGRGGGVVGAGGGAVAAYASKI